MVVNKQLLKAFCKKHGLKLKDDGTSSLSVDVLVVTLTQPDVLWRAALEEFENANLLQEKLGFLGSVIDKLK